MSLENFILKLSSLEKKAKVVLDETIKKEAPQENREQLEQGLNADGQPITKQTIRAGATTYAPSYAKLRRRKGLQTDHIDAKFTGKYHKSIEAKKKSTTSYELKATDPKADKVEKNLGNLIGLNALGLDGLEEKIEEALTNLIKTELV